MQLYTFTRGVTLAALYLIHDILDGSFILIKLKESIRTDNPKFIGPGDFYYRKAMGRQSKQLINKTLTVTRGVIT